MFDIIEGGRRDHAVDLFEPEGFEGALTNVDAPDAGIDGHEMETSWTTTNANQHEKRQTTTGPPEPMPTWNQRTDQKATTPLGKLSIIITILGKSCWRGSRR